VTVSGSIQHLSSSLTAKYIMLILRLGKLLLNVLHLLLQESYFISFSVPTVLPQQSESDESRCIPHSEHGLIEVPHTATNIFSSAYLTNCSQVTASLRGSPFIDARLQLDQTRRGHLKLNNNMAYNNGDVSDSTQCLQLIGTSSPTP